jgi:hypothetical protein
MTDTYSDATSRTVAVRRDALVPVRIQMWHPENWYMDVRTYLDELQIDNPPIEVAPYGDMRRYASSGERYFNLHAHNDYSRPAWKFHRGKPR